MVEGFLTEDELAVFDGIREYLSKNRFFRVNDIIPYLNHTLDKDLNFNALRIEKLLQSLMKKYVVVPGMKLTWEEVLKNELREKIYQLTKKNPGIHLNEIMKTLDIGSHQTLWHLGILQEFNFLRKVKIGIKNAYFDTESDPSEDEFHFYLRNENVQRILRLFKENIGSLSGKTQMSEELNMHYKTLTKYLKIMLEVGLIINDGKKTYQINPETHGRVLKIIS